MVRGGTSLGKLPETTYTINFSNLCKEIDGTRFPPPYMAETLPDLEFDYQTYSEFKMTTNT